MNFTLFGYPKTGKTTLFNLLTGARIETQAYDTGKKEPNLRICPVPDWRLDKLGSIYPEKELKPATMDYVDLAGLSYGEIKTTAYLNYLRRADGLAHVVRRFINEQIPHFRKEISPTKDIQSMEEELVLADFISVESRLEKLEKELKREKTLDGEKEKNILEQIHSHLDKGEAIRELQFTSDEEKRIRHFAFLSQKPVLHIINVDEKDIPLIDTPEKIYSTQKKQTAVMAFCGEIELEILELEGKEKEDFLAEFGLRELSVNKFIRTTYGLLETVTFFTIGKHEIKAWTIKKNTPAITAAGYIHSDIERGFIRAEVVSFEELVKHGSFQAAKEKAVVRLEGKDYIIQDGDVIYFRFSI